MKRILVLLSLVFLALAAQDAAAQTRRVRGQVTSTETGGPLAGVQVLVKGTAVGTLTDATGNFSVAVPEGATTLVVSSIGFRTVEAPIAGEVVNVQISPQAVALEGVVVTALGVERDKKQLGTSVQAVQPETEAREANIVNALSGKVSGVTVTNVGPQGGSARIVIRGANSIAGNNQPLFIVDGIPIDNSISEPVYAAISNRATAGGYGGIDYGNAAQDINPDDIASISILKGPNAAALYGSRAANGAVVITTKTGKSQQGRSGIGITASQNVSFETPLRLPQYQNEYGQGSGGEFEYLDGNYGGTNDGTDESWGPRLDGRLIPQFFSNGQPVPWVANPDNVRNFFETGRTLNTNVAMAGASDRANVRLSLSHLNQEGMYPGFDLGKTTVSLNGGASLTEQLSANASVQYINQDGAGRPGTGYDGDNPMLQFVWFGRQVDTRLLKERRTADGGMFNWNYSYHSNPYWIAFENRNFDDRDRIIGSGNVNYQFTPWLSATLRAGTDWYTDRRKRTYAGGSIGIAPGPNFEDVGANGSFDENVLFTQETNADVLVSANDLRLTPDISFSASAGGAQRWSDFRRNYDFVQNLSAPGIYSLSNAAVTPFSEDYVEEKRVNSVYGQAQFGFRDYWFVDVTGRNDWSSTLPENDNSYFYPSVSTSFVFTDALNMPNNLLSFGKLRASWARVGNDALPYQLESVYTAGLPFGGVPTFGVPNRIPNANLKPESTESWEIGTELSFLRNRLTLEGTYYDKATTNQILAVQISPTSGFTNQVLNAGEVTNKGVELLVNAVPVRTGGGFEWEVTANFAKNNSEVTELYGDLETLVLGTYWSLTVEARKGEPYGALYGTPYVRDSQGRIVVDNLGRPRKGAQKEVLGHYTPDWQGGLTNAFRYRGLDLSFLLDTQQGGELFSVTHMFGRYAGILEETLEGREGGLVVPNSVKVTENGDTVPNDISVGAERFNHGLYGLHEAHVVDASFVKLREAKLGYTLPSSLTRRLGLSGLYMSVVGRNLWLHSPGTNHIDPETAFTAGNAQGIEFGQLPSARSIGLNVTVTP